MTTSGNRMSTFTTASGTSEGKNGEQKKDLWTSLLEDTKGKSGKKLAEKNLLVLGGTTESQRDLLETLSNTDVRRNADRQPPKIPPIANNFALGYTYYDVLDADQEDLLARVSLYFLSSCSPAFTPLLAPLLTPETIPNTLIVILLDWHEPWLWVRQLRGWVQIIQDMLRSLSVECKETMGEVMEGWSDRGRERGRVNLDGTEAVTDTEGDVPLPHGQGEWEDALGLPLCVVCQNAEQIEVIANTYGWKDDMFDVILQHMRTVLLRHGASLIYTPASGPSLLQPLVHSSLGIHSLLKKTRSLQPNVIEREKILVPPNWDSWSKILILRDGFEAESVSNGWSQDLELTFFPAPVSKPTSASEHAQNGGETKATNGTSNGTNTAESRPGDDDSLIYERPPAEPQDFISAFWHGDALSSDAHPTDGAAPPLQAGGLLARGLAPSSGSPSAQALYEQAVPPPAAEVERAKTYRPLAWLEVSTTDTQKFLDLQVPVLEGLKRKDREEREAAEGGGDGGGVMVTGMKAAGTGNLGKSAFGSRPLRNPSDGKVFPHLLAEERDSDGMAEHIGPVQFNVGGIQVDADDMVQRLMDRQDEYDDDSRPSSADDKRPSGEGGGDGSAGASSASGAGKDKDKGKDKSLGDNDALQAFFTGLMKRSDEMAGGFANMPGRPKW